MAIFYPRVFGFSLKNVRVFGFYIFDGLRVLSFSELGFLEFRLKSLAFRVSVASRVPSFPNYSELMNAFFVRSKIEISNGLK